jgi:serine/threonine protein kinase
MNNIDLNYIKDIVDFYDDYSALEDHFPKETIKEDAIAKEIFSFNGDSYQKHVLTFKDPARKAVTVAVKTPAAGSVEERSAQTAAEVLSEAKEEEVVEAVSARERTRSGVIKRFQEKYGLSDEQMEEYLNNAEKLTAFVSTQQRQAHKKSLSARHPHEKIGEEAVDAKLLSLALRLELQFDKQRNALARGLTYEIELPSEVQRANKKGAKPAPLQRLFKSSFGIAAISVDKEKVNLIYHSNMGKGSWNEAFGVFAQGSPMVIRQLQEHSLKRSDKVQQWEDEARLQRELAKENPGILPIHYAVKLDLPEMGIFRPEMRALITPACDGDLAGWDEAALGTPPQANRLNIMYQICTATAKLHNQSFTHGDLKPENFLYRLEKDGSIKIYMTDFQTVQSLGKRVPGWGGTPVFHPPETFRREFFTADMDRKIDDWALGMTGLMLEFPEEGDDLLNAIAKTISPYPRIVTSIQSHSELVNTLMPKLPLDTQKTISERWGKELGDTPMSEEENFNRALNIVLDVVVSEPMNEALKPMREMLKNSANRYHSEVLYPLLHPDINQRIDATEAARRIEELQKP